MNPTKAVLALIAVVGCSGAVRAGPPRVREYVEPILISTAEQEGRLVKAIRAGIPDKNVKDVGECYQGESGLTAKISLKVSVDRVALECQFPKNERSFTAEGVVHIEKWVETPTQTLSGGVLSAQGFAIVSPEKEGGEFMLVDKTSAARDEVKQLSAESFLNFITINFLEAQMAMRSAYQQVLREEKEKAIAEKLAHIRKQLEK